MIPLSNNDVLESVNLLNEINRIEGADLKTMNIKRRAMLLSKKLSRKIQKLNDKNGNINPNTNDRVDL